MENKMESKLTDRSISDIANILGLSRQAVYNKFVKNYWQHNPIGIYWYCT